MRERNDGKGTRLISDYDMYRKDHLIKIFHFVKRDSVSRFHAQAIQLSQRAILFFLAQPIVRNI